MSGAGPRPRWGLESGNAIPSLCDCLVGEGAKSLEEMGISNTARLHYLHAVHKTQFVPQHWFNPFSSAPRTHTHTHTYTGNTNNATHIKWLSWRIFLNFPLAFSWHFPSWSYVLGIIMNICPLYSVLSIHFHLLIWSALSTFPHPSSLPPFRFSDFPFSARLGRCRCIRNGASRNYVFMLPCAVSNICSSIPHRLLDSNHQMGHKELGNLWFVFQENEAEKLMKG